MIRDIKIQISTSTNVPKKIGKLKKTKTEGVPPNRSIPIHIVHQSQFLTSITRYRVVSSYCCLDFEQQLLMA